MRLKRNFFLLFILVYGWSAALHASAEPPLSEITFIRTGFADAVLIGTEDGNYMLVDAGDVRRPKLVAAYLEERGIRSLERVILTHPHKNHFGGLSEILNQIEVKSVFWNGEKDQENPFPKVIEKIQSMEIPFVVLKAGERLQLSPRMQAEVLHPGADMSFGVNGNSLVLRIQDGEASALLMADIETEVQDLLIERHGDTLQADLVQIPHHGGPLSDLFIRFFRPRFFALSTGPSFYGPPYEDQLARLQGKLLRTDTGAHLHFYSDGKSYRVSEFRQQSSAAEIQGS